MSSSIPLVAVTSAVTHPASEALSARTLRSVVLPVPSAPDMIVVNSGLRLSDANARFILSTVAERPARRAGTSPKVGVKGFSRTGIKYLLLDALACSEAIIPEMVPGTSKYP